MFIIFDLDDTLIDTSGSITPFQLKKALDAVISAGALFENTSSALAQLNALNRTAPSGEAALCDFLKAHGVSNELIEGALGALHAMPDPELVIEPVIHAKEVLEALRYHKLAIVTIGKKELQLYKLKKAGFDPHLFSKIIVTTEKSKKGHYATLLDEFKQSPLETVVVGDRVAVDLTPAKALGCHTVQIMRGRGLSGHSSGAFEDVDDRIYDLSALIGIIDRQKVISKG